MTKELVKENVTKQDDSRDAIQRRTLTNSCKLTAFAQLYPLQIGRGRSEECPLQAESVRVCHENSGIPQSLIKVTDLTSYRLNVLKTLRKAAFTLAEVLITLGVIGIVAAMTIPTLVNNYQKKLFVTKMKYTYSLLSNALALSVLENGNANTWNYGKSSDKASTGSSEDLTYIVNTYFKPYLKISEDIGVNAGGYHLVLNNGITLSFFTDGYINSETNIYTPTVIYIIAGNNKNTTSYSDSSRDYSRHDMFFEIVKINTLLTFCYGSRINREDIINDKQYGCNKTIAKNLRYNCGTLIKFDGWEIKDDYPW